MKIFTSPSELAAAHPHIVFAAGFFDGVHVGHRAIFTEAKNAGGDHACVLTFDRHARNPALLTPFAERLRLIAETGVGSCFLLPFTRELKGLTPDIFVSQVLGAWLTPGKSITLVAGENWRFGRGGAGDLDTAVTASGGKIKAVRVPLATLDGETVSSSAIRRLITSGDLARASEMLGRRYEIRGVAVRGRGIGATIGFATANIEHSFEVMPPCGVYAVKAQLPASAAWLPAVANLGRRPTFDNQALHSNAATLEVHILNGFDQNLHGAEIAVRFIARIRDEQKFNSAGDLAKQIKNDIEKTQFYFNNEIHEKQVAH
ncbi:MAG: riboflavin biosynthesis protein RibF [Kiritimatiellaeota bacterium]|nr:riboflavin biosynthesis protein RibF [Kiritimatiellota bacterium]